MDLSAKADLIRALEKPMSLSQLKNAFPKLTELDIKTVIKQLKDDGFVRVDVPQESSQDSPLQVATSTAFPPNTPQSLASTGPSLGTHPDEIYILSGKPDDVVRELFKRGMSVRNKGTVRQSDPKQ